MLQDNQNKATLENSKATFSGKDGIAIIFHWQRAEVSVQNMMNANK